MQINSESHPFLHDGPCKLDLHADTCCAGTNCTVIEYTNKVCTVIGYIKNDPEGGEYQTSP